VAGGGKKADDATAYPPLEKPENLSADYADEEERGCSL
jgi:hypothetical protein